MAVMCLVQCRPFIIRRYADGEAMILASHLIQQQDSEVLDHLQDEFGPWAAGFLADLLRWKAPPPEADAKGGEGTDAPPPVLPEAS